MKSTGLARRTLDRSSAATWPQAPGLPPVNTPAQRYRHWLVFGLTSAPKMAESPKRIDLFPQCRKSRDSLSL